MDHNASHMPQSYYLDPERKLAEIQRQKEHVERQLLARSKQLEHFHSSQERERRQTVDRVMVMGTVCLHAVRAHLQCGILSYLSFSLSLEISLSLS